MMLLELAGIFFSIFIVFGFAAKDPRPVRFLARAVIVSASAWMAEESCILLYRFYAYHPNWNLCLDQVPLLIVVTWPIIIFSAMELTSRIRIAHPVKGLFAGAAVVASDSLFIEPISVKAGLWQWTLPGLFNVPPIGILGWFFFALLSIGVLNTKRLKGPRTIHDTLLLVIPVLGTHFLLLLSWWGAFRWINFQLPIPAIVGVGWCVSFVMIATILKKQTGRGIRKRTLLLRIPAALFFFGLLVVKATAPLPLAAYAIAFVPPYVLLMLQQYRRHAT
ncbi:MAG: carotenoid biosynthesis protein [Desulfobacterales bacterium]|nr:carotenoid biosynthesis protein [Desulfobacterales bacterium]